MTGGCGAFPQHSDCVGDNWSFCSMWRTVGFLMSFAVIIEGAALIGYAVVLLGGKQKRDKGYKVISGLLGLAAVVQMAGMAVVVGLRVVCFVLVVGFGRGEIAGC